MSDAVTPRDVMTEAEAADYIRRPAGTLRQWRYRREGPPYIRQGAFVRYLREDLDNWLAAHRVEPEPAA